MARPPVEQRAVADCFALLCKGGAAVADGFVEIVSMKTRGGEWVMAAIVGIVAAMWLVFRGARGALQKSGAPGA